MTLNILKLLKRRKNQRNTKSDEKNIKMIEIESIFDWLQFYGMWRWTQNNFKHQKMGTLWKSITHFDQCSVPWSHAMANCFFSSCFLFIAIVPMIFGLFALIVFGKWALCFDYLISVNPLQLLLYNRLCWNGWIVLVERIYGYKNECEQLCMQRRWKNKEGRVCDGKTQMVPFHSFRCFMLRSVCACIFYVFLNRIIEASRTRLYFFFHASQSRKEMKKW